MWQLKTIQGKKKKGQSFPAHPGNALACFILSVPSLVAPTPSEEQGCYTAQGHHWARATRGQHCAPQAQGHGWDRGTTKHQHRAGQPGSQRDIQVPTAPRMCAPWRGLWWQETTWAFTDWCLCHFSTSNLSASVTEAQLWYRCGKKACQKNACNHCMFYL